MQHYSVANKVSFEEAYMRYEFQQTVSRYVQAYMEMDQFDELDKYINKLVQNCCTNPVYLSDLFGILQEKCPNHATRAKKLLLLL